MHEAPTFQLLSSTRYDPYLTSFTWNEDEDGPSAFFLLPLHYQRLVSATETHGWDRAKALLDYKGLKSACLDAVLQQTSRDSSSSVFRIRITVSIEGRIAVTATPLPASFAADPTLVPPPESFSSNETNQTTVLRVYIDRESTTPSIFTRTKTTFREMYDSAKARNESELSSGQGGAAWDILLCNDDNKVMEATIFNVAFYRSSKWVTPSISTGCLPGVLRKWLLDNRRITEDVKGQLTRDSIQNGELVLLFNGVQGVRLGKIYI